MKVTVKGQVTIPREVREKLGITHETEVEFVEDQGRFYIVKTHASRHKRGVTKFRGIAEVNLSTDEIMELTRGE